MEEETLLRERLQAITDKRRIREEIEKKRRNIEEEKLKLQYLKKKTLREQWLMDGLSTLSEEEQESVKAQTEDNQQQTKLLQSNIDRIKQEIAVLETQELELSAKEEILLKQLKEVEKTPEDIIKVLLVYSLSKAWRLLTAYYNSEPLKLDQLLSWEQGKSLQCSML